MKKRGIAVLLFFSAALGLMAKDEMEIPYYPEEMVTNAYQRSRCRLDIRYPEKKGFPTIVWFHGGGLSSGQKHWIALGDSSVAQVRVNYRLHPQGKHPDYLYDAGAAVAWVMKNIARYGGDPDKIFVSGHSAGGYLSAMIGMDPRWLAFYGESNRKLAGIAPISGQMTTHFLVKRLRGDQGPQYRPLIDEYAPLYYAAKELPPICLIMGDRKIEWPCRVEENELLAVSLRRLGHPQVEFYEMGGLNHGTVGEGGMILLRNFVRKFSAKPKSTAK